MLNSYKKYIYILPSTITSLNLLCGFSSIIVGAKGNFHLAAMLLFIGLIFDLIDGRVARMTSTHSAFGEQLDSISDVITFGAAPAILVYNKFFIGRGTIGFITSFIFLLCGALRLARFNANISKINSSFFQGFPIPVAALSLVGLTLFSLEYPIINSSFAFISLYILVFSLLMISNIPFYSFKKSEWIRLNQKLFFTILLLLIILTILYAFIMITLIINLYLFSSMIYFAKNKKELHSLFKERKL